jgi:hypothetical protein
LDEEIRLSDPRRPSIESGSDALDSRALAYGRAPHAIADLGGIHLKLGQGSAQGIAVHAEFVSGLALIAFVVRKDFKNIASLKLPNGVGVGDTGAVHLNDKTVQFALQRLTPRWSSDCDTSSL